VCEHVAGGDALSAISLYYGHADVPIGVYRGPIGSPQASAVCERAACGWTNQGRGVYAERLVSMFPTAQGAPTVMLILAYAFIWGYTEGHEALLTRSHPDAINTPAAG